MSWEKVKIVELCNMNSGGTPSRAIKEYYIGDIPWAKISDIESAKGGIIKNTEEHISISGLDSINNRIFPKGTLLLAMYGSVGKAAFTGIEMSTNQAILGIRIKDENILDYSFLKYWFQTIKAQLLNRAVGGTLQNISLGIVKDLQIPLPPLPTQKRIAEILDAADALRRKDQELLRKYDELAQAIFIDMIGEIEKDEFKLVAISDIIERGKNKLRSGPFGSDLLHSEFVESGVFVLGIDNVVNNKFEINRKRFITEEKFNALSRYQVYPGDVLISVMATIGRTAVVPDNLGKAINSKHLVAITPNKEIIDSFFLSYLFANSQSIKRQIKQKTKGAIMDGLNLGIIKELSFNLPPIEIQKRFVENLKSIEHQKELVLTSNSGLLFDSLLQQAFKGELVK